MVCEPASPRASGVTQTGMVWERVGVEREQRRRRGRRELGILGVHL